MGLLDMLGLGDPNAPAVPEGQSFNDRLMNPLTQAGLQLLANNGTPASQGMMNGVPQALTRAASYQQEQKKQNKTLEYLRQNHPDIAQMVDSGLDVGDAFNYAMRDRQFNQELALKKSEMARGPGPTAEMRNFEYAQKNPEFAAMLGSGGDQPTSIREINERSRLAPQYGVDPSTPEGRAFVLTGKLPGSDRTVTAGDRQAIRDADDQAMASENASALLDQAMQLSDKAYEGMGASARATVAANTVGDEGALATIQMDNIVKEQALGQLKSIFGAAPTEGERQILLEIQGSSSMPKSVRKATFMRAKQLVERRLQYNRDRANELRGGTYYDPKPAGGGAQPSAAPADGGMKTKYGLE